MLKVEDGFALGKGFLSAITPETDMVFLCEPNNPTGVTTAPALLTQILKRCRETGTLLVLDEFYLKLKNGEFYLHELPKEEKPYKAVKMPLFRRVFPKLRA